MPKIDLSSIPSKSGSAYPEPHDRAVRGRTSQKLGAASGITQFGANLVRLAPGAMSSLRHWHEEQDEFLVVTEGVLTLVDDDGPVEMRVGDCAAFPAGDRNGHHMQNLSDAPGAFVVIGTHTKTETAWYSDVDMKVTAQDGVFTFTHKDGRAFAPPDPAFPQVSELLTKALIENNFALYQSLFALPLRIEVRDGLGYAINSLDELEKDFELYRDGIRKQNVTDIFREILAKDISPDGKSRVVHTRVRLLSRTTLIMDPVHMRFELQKDGDDWRISAIQSSSEHIDWTLGR
ncbi:cupin domain-containing protein [Tropicibacter sp. S64]|uniref:cupin domain-containing protein n=1 Tax=Tropicibacter sp. S64 TaxID=3415122 RepID=UPI003C7C752A